MSAAISFGTASAVAGRQERGKQAYAARKLIQKTVSDYVPMAFDKERQGVNFGMNDGPTVNVVDMAVISRVIEASEPLPWLRRKAIRLRCRKIFGRSMTEAAELHPITDPSKAFGQLVFVGYQANKKGKPLYDEKALIHHRETDKEIARLRRQLLRLRRGR
ncbi:hypothetical protein [Amycolatopsis sp. 195334CR]|uniref:hypothetical protein n=1 Tax=Amycolatopsis sp. 195334CR TaxID=2814588 RepID=UPI001A8CF9EE|nr:hypothetical protein [Amycolatopsis sp. 195334CR]MBN6037459.1 hypothetical protein [Amycolatopsis sp. 195334CR]